MSSQASPKLIEPLAVKAMLSDGRELALIDLREELIFSRSHLLWARSVPLSRLELRFARLVPRRDTRIVLCDDGDGLVERAAKILAGAGYTDISFLQGGIAAWEKAGHKMDGSAARVLDYSALWIHPDGSSEMLEHEILRMQSQEAVSKEAEQPPPGGLVLNLRVIKPDGSILEPEPVAGKQTLTMPHLEVGDYVEIEHITATASENAKGKIYRGPHWFFREADKGYWRSEFVVLTPKDRNVDIEIVGKVPAPKTAEKGTFVERRAIARI